MKHINLSRIANSRNNSYVTWQGNEYELPEYGMKVSKHVEAWWFIN